MRLPQNPGQTQNPVRPECFYPQGPPEADLNANIRTAADRRKSMEQSLFYPGADATTIAMNHILWFRDQVKKGHSSYRTTNREERDAFGAELPLSTPSGGSSYVKSKFSELLFIEGSDPFDYSGGCELDGMPTSCSNFNRMVEAGAVRTEDPFPYYRQADPDQNRDDVTRHGTRWVPITHPVQDFGMGIHLIYERSPFRDNDRFSGGWVIYAPQNREEERFTAAVNELKKRLEADKGKNPCAEFFGGLKNAEKKLKQMIEHHVFGPTGIEGAAAVTRGSSTIIDQFGDFMDNSGSRDIRVTPQQNYITLDNVAAAAFALAHELGHRAKKLREDSPDVVGKEGAKIASWMNSGDIRTACFAEAKVMDPKK
jgi:hypothetical protein